MQGAIQTINGSSVKPVNAKLLAAIQRAHKTTGTAGVTSIAGASVNKQSASQQSAISNATGADNSVQSQVAASTPGSVS